MSKFNRILHYILFLSKKYVFSGSLKYSSIAYCALFIGSGFSFVFAKNYSRTKKSWVLSCYSPIELIKKYGNYYFCSLCITHISRSSRFSYLWHLKIQSFKYLSLVHSLLYLFILVLSWLLLLTDSCKILQSYEYHSRFLHFFQLLSSFLS